MNLTHLTLYTARNVSCNTLQIIFSAKPSGAIKVSKLKIIFNVVLVLALTACGGGGSDVDPTSLAVSGGGSVTAPVSPPTETTTSSTTSGYTKATLNGVYSRCPIKQVLAATSDAWWTCIAGLEFVGLTAFGGKACSLIVRSDGAFEYTSNGVKRTTPTASNNLATAASTYQHAIIGTAGYHNFRASSNFVNQALIQSGISVLAVEVVLSQVPDLVSFEVSYQGESCSLNIQ